ncbi:MAG: bifunctional phosphoribosylaminoimidazolecarboxamide formyltransferase/IMP cyclohydrolase, partial [Candidatus Portiera sp.]|nr:bifunctional phosphoribosylaminoimidazolecarboxamide formyltransferase/IMP cyclohydrolase [Portiera sp.]
NRALVSVSDKTSLDKLAEVFQEFNVEVFSTGGTAKQLQQYLPEVKDLTELTSFPEILGGRVKTLHPHVHGGILARKDNSADMATLKELQLQPFDLVVVNLYPFAEQLLKQEDTLDQEKNLANLVEFIDIGGITLLRASAKNYNNVVLMTDPQDYGNLANEMRSNNGSVRGEFSAKRMAAAFTLSSSYDSQIANYFSQQLTSTGKDNNSPNSLNSSSSKASGGDNQQHGHLPKQLFSADLESSELRYGENPHQQAALYRDPTDATGLAGSQLLNGKPLSYNNLVDANSAWRLACELSGTCCVIVKHAQPCGVAVAPSQVLAYERALLADKESSFGGIIAVNKILDEETALKIKDNFIEVVIAPDYSQNALTILSSKKNLRLLKTIPHMPSEETAKIFKTISGGVLMQTEDQYIPTADSLEWVSKVQPTDDQQVTDLLFAWQVAKFCHSNAIVIAKDGATCGIGAGQTSRVFSVRLALLRVADNNLDISGAAVASDAFFPFADSVALLAEKDIKSIIQPGGSKRDDEVIALADEKNIAMAFTGHRCFFHG